VIILFFEFLKNEASLFKKLIEDKLVRIYAQYDPDGISSAAIMAKALLRMNKNFEVRFFKQLNSKVVEKIEASEDKVLVFLDFGSGHLDILKNVIEKTQVFIIDHHEPLNFSHQNLHHINPLLFNENAEDYCTSIIAYLFSLSLDEKNRDLIEIMIYGVIGDRKENSKVFEEILEKYNKGEIIVENGLKFYGKNRPIHKVLAYSFEPYLPGISGDELAAAGFLESIGIKVKDGNGWRTFNSLSEQEIKRIVDNLSMHYANPEELIGKNFIIAKNVFSDAREIASMINACSRLGKIENAFRFCLKDEKIFGETLVLFEEYRKKLGELIAKVEKNTIEKENALFIVNREISDSMIGVLVSILSSKENKPIFGIGFDEEIGMLKVSARVGKNKNINLRNLLVSIVKELGGEAGGHKDAAGAYLPIGKENEFVERINAMLGDNID